MTQIDKFDKQHKYIKKWVPEFGTEKYVKPMVDHKEARELALDAYKQGIES
jgi:deoxyribodipyrimidine photo-lyase